MQKIRSPIDNAMAITVLHTSGYFLLSNLYVSYRIFLSSVFQHLLIKPVSEKIYSAGPLLELY